MQQGQLLQSFKSWTPQKMQCQGEAPRSNKVAASFVVDAWVHGNDDGQNLNSHFSKNQNLFAALQGQEFNQKNNGDAWPQNASPNSFIFRQDQIGAHLLHAGGANNNHRQSFGNAGNGMKMPIKNSAIYDYGQQSALSEGENGFQGGGYKKHTGKQGSSKGGQLDQISDTRTVFAQGASFVPSVSNDQTWPEID